MIDQVKKLDPFSRELKCVFPAIQWEYNCHVTIATIHLPGSGEPAHQDPYPWLFSCMIFLKQDRRLSLE
jgi:hypothetical protein